MDQKSTTGGPTNKGPDQEGGELGGHHQHCSRVCIGEVTSREVTQQGGDPGIRKQGDCCLQHPGNRGKDIDSLVSL